MPVGFSELESPNSLSGVLWEGNRAGSRAWILALPCHKQTLHCCALWLLCRYDVKGARYGTKEFGTKSDTTFWHSGVLLSLMPIGNFFFKCSF